MIGLQFSLVLAVMVTWRVNQQKENSSASPSLCHSAFYIIKIILLQNAAVVFDISPPGRGHPSSGSVHKWLRQLGQDQAEGRSWRQGQVLEAPSAACQDVQQQEGRIWRGARTQSGLPSSGSGCPEWWLSCCSQFLTMSVCRKLPFRNQRPNTFKVRSQKFSINFGLSNFNLGESVV